jgi:hypothetical protein
MACPKDSLDSVFIGTFSGSYAFCRNPNALHGGAVWQQHHAVSSGSITTIIERKAAMKVIICLLLVSAMTVLAI